MIVVECNDNESPQGILPGFHVQVIRGLTRLLTMAEVAEVELTAWSSLTVWQLFLKRAREANINYRKKNKFRCRVSRIEKRLVKLKRKLGKSFQ